MAAYSYSLDVSSMFDVSSLLGSVKSSATATLVQQIISHQEWLEMPVLHHGVIEILHQISDLLTAAQNEDTPTKAACKCAEQILYATNQIARIPHDITATVESSEGDILVHWDGQTKGVVLICSREGGAPSIYRERLNRRVTIWSDLHKDGSAASLSEALAWLVTD